MDKSSPVVWLGVWLQLDSLAGKGSVRVCKGFPVSAHRNMQIRWSGDSKWLVGVNVSEFGCPPWTQELNIRTDIIWQSRFSINKPSVEYSAEPSWQTDSGKISVWLIKILLVRHQWVHSLQSASCRAAAQEVSTLVHKLGQDAAKWDAQRETSDKPGF